MHHGFANPGGEIRTRESIPFSLALITYYSVNGHLHFVRENLSYGSPILLRTADEEKRQSRDQVYLRDNLQESMYENDGSSVLGVMMVMLCSVCFARLDFVEGKRNSFLS